MKFIGFSFGLSMESVNFASFIFLLILIPLGMFSAGINDCLKNDAYFPTILVKFIVATLFHLIISGIIAIIFFVFVNTTLKSALTSSEDKIFAQTVALFITFLYAFCGWLLCSFVGGKFIRSLKDLGLSAKK